MKSRKHTKPPVLAGIALLAIVTLCWLSRTRQESPPHPGSTARPPAGSAPVATVPVHPESLAGFDRWLETHATASATERAAVTPEVLQLARERRVTMESLIRTDPRLALEHAVTLSEWKSLPDELRAEVEEPFSAMARYQVLPICGNRAPGQNLPDATRLVSIDGQPRLSSHVFGSRVSITSKEEAPVQGIRLGSLAALHEKTFRKLSAGETPAATATYPIANPQADRDFATGEPLGDAPVTALAGGKVFLFAGDSSFQTFADAVDALDKTPAPQGGAALVFRAYPADGNGGFNLGETVTMNNVLASAWTETKKKVFIIRCDFSDKPDAGANATPVPSTYASLLNTTISDNIRDYSYGKTWIEATVSPTVIRLSQPSTTYAALDAEQSSDNTALRDEAIAKYTTANSGFSASNYDIVGVWFTAINMKNHGLLYAGLAGGNALWIQGTQDPEVHVHEFGHNYGIGHSSFWKPSVGSTNPFDPSGSHDEYGDPFDVMGGGPIPQGVFHSQAKQRLNWLGTGEWTDATAAGSAIHRLHRIDDPATAGVRGLRVTKGADEYLWLSYRRLFANNALRAGANIVWEKADEDQGWLIDTTPGSQSGTSDRTDGSLVIGRTFSTGNSHITPLARGGSGSGEWLDVRVNTGPFPGNAAPAATIAGPSTIGARQTVVFTAQATDPNGDPLAYSWDFGQGFAFDNNPTSTFSWTVGGTFTVKVTVSDMKGGTTQATKTVTVTDDITTWTARSHPSDSEFYDLAANSNTVVAVGHEITTSTDGVTWTASDLALNGYGFAGIWDGTQFVVAGDDYSHDDEEWFGAIFTSPDASPDSWERRMFTGTRLHDVAYGNGVHIAISDGGAIYRSTNGAVTWNPVTSGTTHSLSSVAYGDGKFVIVGRASPSVTGNPIVLTSTNGLTWTNVTAGSGLDTWHDFQTVHWAGDRFLASGWYSKLRYSADAGDSFSTTRTINEHTPGVAYGNGIWFAAGTLYGGSGADVDLVSADGVNWTNLAVPAVENRRAAVFFKNTFITVGANRTIRQSGTVTPGTGGYYAWRESNLPDHGPASMPDGDHDGDGVDNLIEYALGRSPVSGNGNDGPASLPQAVVTASEPVLEGRLVLQASVPEPSPTDVVHVVEASSSLTGSWTTLATKTGSGSWTWNAGGTSRIVSSAPSGGRVTVKVGDSVTIAAEAHRFLRVRTVVNQ
jgi:hypothetical protein